MKRSGGILMPISSLPSKYGIGTLGAEARNFISFLREAGQSFWQILPTGPTGYGDSPYQSFSSFAGNPYLIDFDDLLEHGLLKKEEYDAADWGDDPTAVDYYRISLNRGNVLKKAVRRLLADPPEDFSVFLEKNRYWLPDYALFMAEKDDHGGGAFSGWERKIRMHDPETAAAERERLSDAVRYYEGVQYLFRVQWDALRDFAHRSGIRLIGDVPIYVSPDSSDLWGHPELFQLGSDGTMNEVAGCPPDKFSADGQLWGNPLYDWEAMKADGYDWWTKRIAHQFTIVDVLRIDHFRGFESYYEIPGNSDDAKIGRWRKGPGIEFFKTVEKKLGSLNIIAEDLGYLTPDVVELVRETGYPGMKVLLFAFDTRDTGYGYLPHCYGHNCVVYTGTHDNDTVEGWMKSAPEDCVRKAVEYLGLNEREGNHWGFIRTAYESVADLAVIPLQDFLGLDNSARINVPSTTGGNWVWRTDRESISRELAGKIRHWMEITDRLPRE
jgi:4-alpha-glucanotransferase